jgi:hypothetical protein
MNSWRFDKSPRHAIEVDYHDFRKELLTHIRTARTNRNRRPPRPFGAREPVSSRSTFNCSSPSKGG